MPLIQPASHKEGDVNVGVWRGEHTYTEPLGCSPMVALQDRGHTHSYIQCPGSLVLCFLPWSSGFLLLSPSLASLKDMPARLSHTTHPPTPLPCARAPLLAPAGKAEPLHRSLPGLHGMLWRAPCLLLFGEPTHIVCVSCFCSLWGSPQCTAASPVLRLPPLSPASQ